MVLFHHLMMIQQRCFSEVYRADVTYDGAGRLVKTSSSQYTYDDENYRIKSGTEEYCYDRQNKNLLVRYAKDGSYGDICDAVNAVLYLTEGDYINAGLSALSIIPGADAFTKTGKASKVLGNGIVESGLKHLDNVADGIKKLVKKADDAIDLEKHLPKKLLTEEAETFAKKADKVADDVVEDAAKAIKSGRCSTIKNIQSMTPQQLIEYGWEDITNPKMAANTNSREFYDQKSGLKIRFDKGVDGANGFEAVDHYHVLNPNYTNKKIDYYLDIDGKPVGKGSKASHIVIKGEE